jgi:AefR-like transcriptional repressor, C-terminal domain
MGAASTRARARPHARIQRQTTRGALDVPGALAAHRFILLVLVEALMRSSFGGSALPDAEVDEIVEAGVTMWLRRYRAHPADGA